VLVSAHLGNQYQRPAIHNSMTRVHKDRLSGAFTVVAFVDSGDDAAVLIHPVSTLMVSLWNDGHDPP
jgi:hypothetical protein